MLYGSIAINKMIHCPKNEVFFSICDQIRRNLHIWSHLLKKSLMKKFIFWAVIKLHERSLRIIYFDKSLSYEEPSEKDRSVSLHYKGLYILATEMFKVVKKISPERVKEDFLYYFRSNRNLRQSPIFYSRRIKWVKVFTNGLSKICGRQPLKNFK